MIIKKCAFLILIIPTFLNSETMFFGGNNLGSDEMALTIENTNAIYYFNGEGDGCEGFKAKSSQNGDIYYFTNVISSCTEKKLKDFQCKNKKDDESLIFSDFLQCDNELILYNKNKGVKENQNRNYKGFDVITLGLKRGIAISNLKLREKPNIQSRTFTCYFTHIKDDKIREKEINFIPKNIKLTIIARTLEEETIGEKRNYWYLVFPASDSYNGCILKNTKQKEGWVFGEYIKFD
ncbi:SH3 domain-containing protein [Leptospira ognonensis]|uniref:SH3 domain-containing protein n=1 Tax=Leptospira ognonensis TaxID=2484945 RepID=A0A4R9JTC0_9LEPT|nr:SH3 domain-containing protein [Leptospira ognonensis]TGL55405.1 SH3 domain-containing protein [Leptospira ognonensis]